jgi:hypothetical protein
VSGQQEQMKIPIQAYERYSYSPFSREISLARGHLIHRMFNSSVLLGSGKALEIHNGKARSAVCGDPQTGSIALTSDCRAQRLVSEPNIGENALG